MTPSTIVAYLAVGCFAGCLSGMLGIGGGVLVIPLLTLLFHYSHKEAVGTSLGMLLPPIGIFACWAYYKAGKVNVAAAAMLAAGFALGAFVGSWVASSTRFPEIALQRIFGFFLLYYAGTILLRSDRQIWAAGKTAGLVVAFAVGGLILQRLGRRWEISFDPAGAYRERIKSGPPPDFEI